MDVAGRPASVRQAAAAGDSVVFGDASRREVLVLARWKGVPVVEVPVRVTYPDQEPVEFVTTCRIDTPVELVFIATDAAPRAIATHNVIEVADDASAGELALMGVPGDQEDQQGIQERYDCHGGEAGLHGSLLS